LFCDAGSIGIGAHGVVMSADDRWPAPPAAMEENRGPAKKAISENTFRLSVGCSAARITVTAKACSGPTTGTKKILAQIMRTTGNPGPGGPRDQFLCHSLPSHRKSLTSSLELQ
jgi:hypothetical protein